MFSVCMGHSNTYFEQSNLITEMIKTEKLRSLEFEVPIRNRVANKVDSKKNQIERETVEFSDGGFIKMNTTKSNTQLKMKHSGPQLREALMMKWKWPEFRLTDDEGTSGLDNIFASIVKAVRTCKDNNYNSTTTKITRMGHSQLLSKWCKSCVLSQTIKCWLFWSTETPVQLVCAKYCVFGTKLWLRVIAYHNSIDNNRWWNHPNSRVSL